MRVQRQLTGEVLDLSGAPALGFGGTARILAVPAEGALAAKLYLHPTPAHARKLELMLASAREAPRSALGHSALAWPLDLLRDADDSACVIGFLMPRAPSARPLADLCSREVRRLECPDVTYASLLRAAGNLAAAVQAVHARGHVIGALNPAKVLVGSDFWVTLIDTDSFQVCDPRDGTLHRCPSGLRELAPPELQGKPLTEVVRTPEHDRFALAVLLFQLLMDGVHPFAGDYRGEGKAPPLEERIAAGHFPYCLKATAPYGASPTAPSFQTLAPALRDLFVRCFEEGHAHPAKRPDARAWQVALQDAAASLSMCTENPRHRFSSHLSACPWCDHTALFAGRRSLATMAPLSQFAPPQAQANGDASPRLRHPSPSKADGEGPSPHNVSTQAPLHPPSMERGGGAEGVGPVPGEAGVRHRSSTPAQQTTGKRDQSASTKQRRPGSRARTAGACALLALVPAVALVLFHRSASSVDKGDQPEAGTVVTSEPEQPPSLPTLKRLNPQPFKPVIAPAPRSRPKAPSARILVRTPPSVPPTAVVRRKHAGSAARTTTPARPSHPPQPIAVAHGPFSEPSWRQERLSQEANRNAVSIRVPAMNGRARERRPVNGARVAINRPVGTSRLQPAPLFSPAIHGRDPYGNGIAASPRTASRSGAQKPRLEGPPRIAVRPRPARRSRIRIIVTTPSSSATRARPPEVRPLAAPPQPTDHQPAEAPVVSAPPPAPPPSAAESIARARQQELEQRRQAEAEFAAAQQRERARRQQAEAEFARAQQEERRRRQETEAQYRRTQEAERRR